MLIVLVNFLPVVGGFSGGFGGRAWHPLRSPPHLPCLQTVSCSFSYWGVHQYPGISTSTTQLELNSWRSSRLSANGNFGTGEGTSTPKSMLGHTASVEFMAL